MSGTGDEQQTSDPSMFPDLRHVVAAMMFEIECDQACDMRRVIRLIGLASEIASAEIGRGQFRKIGQNFRWPRYEA